MNKPVKQSEQMIKMGFRERKEKRKELLKSSAFICPLCNRAITRIGFGNHIQDYHRITPVSHPTTIDQFTVLRNEVERVGSRIGLEK